ncbi:MAG: ABC transporter transmembrane domain-containing protein, partial [Clostridia bacterium]|nr:ABC transporter transmembrane domain-containing protein [Clostridia bacterium]
MNMPEEQDFTAKKIDFNLWKRLYRYALREPKYMAIILIALVVVALVDILYPLFSSYAIDRFIVAGTTEGLAPFAIVYALVIILQGLGVVTFIMMSGRIEMGVAYAIRQDAFLRLQQLSFSFYDKTAVGYLMARMVSDVGRLADMIAWSIIDVLWSALFIIGCVITMFTLSWKLALIVLAVLPPLALASYYLLRLVLKYQREVRKQNSRITGAFNEGIMGAMTTKTLVREEANAQEFQALTGRMRRISLKSALVSAAF